MEETPIYAPASPVAPEAAEFARAINGYAPGPYFGRCCHCKQEFLGDKRAVSCPKCAYEAAFAFLTAEAAALRTQLAEAEEARKADRERHKVEVLDMLRDMRLPRLGLPPQEDLGGEYNHEWDFVCGQNKERQAINDYCRQKAYEYSPEGIGPDPTTQGEWDTRPAAGIQEKGGAAA